MTGPCTFCEAERKHDREPETIYPHGRRLEAETCCPRCALTADGERRLLRHRLSVAESWAYSGPFRRYYPVEEVVTE